MRLFNFNCFQKQKLISFAIFTFSLETLVYEPNSAKLWYWTIIADSQGAGVSGICLLTVYMLLYFNLLHSLTLG